MEYQSNSHKSKQESDDSQKKRAHKIASGQVKARKKKGMRKFADIFVQEDVDSVKAYVFFDVLVPALKDLVSDVIKNGIDRILYGETNRSEKRGKASKISYRRFYEDRDYDYRDRRGPIRTGYDFEDYILDNRGEAEEILMTMDDILDQYGVVSVLDYYDLLGVSSTPTDNKYGWTNLRNAKVVHVRGGYIIKLPRAMPLD